LNKSFIVCFFFCLIFIWKQKRSRERIRRPQTKKSTQLLNLFVGLQHLVATTQLKQIMDEATIMTNSTSTSATTTPRAASEDVTQKSDVLGSKILGAENHICSADGCKKTVHVMCYQGVVLMDKKRKTYFPQLPSFQLACTKSCYNSAITAHSSDGGRGNWLSGGKGGPEDPHTSMNILLGWMTTESDYSRFCGTNKNWGNQTTICS
jgi:hypothetical protein